MERLRNAVSSRRYSFLENDRTAAGRLCWTDKAKNFIAMRALRRFLLTLTLILVFVNLFRARELFRGFISFDGTLPIRIPAGVDWSQYAYCQYVTNEDYLCNSVMIFEALERVGVKASKVMMYPSDWDITADNHVGKLIRQAQEKYNVQLAPVHIQHFNGDATWADSFTKLLAFNQTQFKRVLSLDSDATVLKSMDELFLIPSSPVAMPRAYWLEKELSSQLVLVEPSEFEFRRILKAFTSRSSHDFDMEIVNNLYGSNCIVIPHRRYDLLSGEFRKKDHRRYLGSEEETWDPDKVLDEAKFVHFSDWPLPKPWLPHETAQEEEIQPGCKHTSQGEDCRDRIVWLGLYADFARRRKEICDTELVVQTSQVESIDQRRDTMS
jgi:alpha-N-acetylglucosamine transferase